MSVSDLICPKDSNPNAIDKTIIAALIFFISCVLFVSVKIKYTKLIQIKKPRGNGASTKIGLFFYLTTILQPIFQISNITPKIIPIPIADNISNANKNHITLVRRASRCLRRMSFIQTSYLRALGIAAA